MILLKIFFCFLLSLNIFAAENYIDSINITKVKKLIEKEESIALAYKKYLLEKATIPTNITNLITEGYLPSGFNTKNNFGETINFSTKVHNLKSFTTSNTSLKSNIYDYYYSNKYRTYTKAPLSIANSDIEIILSPKEKLFYTYKDKITTNLSNKNNKYYLDEKGVLHWYDSLGAYKFSFDEQLIVDDSVTMFNTDGSLNLLYQSLVKDVTFSGQTILYKKDGVAAEYLNLGQNVGLVKVNSESRDIGKTVIQFSRRAGGMIVNGDIYTWGNNANRITGINIDKYTKVDGTIGSKYPVITGLVRVKAKIYDDDLLDGKDLTKFYSQNYFSSPFRPKFVDFFSTVYAGTCGISTKGELYCGGKTGLSTSFGYSFTHVDSSGSEEMLYRSTFFDGKIYKAAKIFQNNQLWLILGADGYIYRWGFDFSGFSGNGEVNFNRTNQNTNKLPESISTIKFSDITYLLTIGYRKMAGLSTTGAIYIWGVEDEISNNKSCIVTWESKSMNLCAPLKVDTSNSNLTSNISFESIQGGLEAFVALGTDGKYYKVHQPKGKKIQVESVNNAIKLYSSYSSIDDSEILSVDFSSKLNGSILEWNKGIVWVNGKNQLKGDYFTYDNKNDTLFTYAISKIKWKKIKVISDDNGMCGIDINNQMYCWGIQSYYRSGSTSTDQIGNTFMIPVFNTNLYDMSKDYLVAEGGYDGYLSSMTSSDWTTSDSNKPFFMKYPTYIGGFNYEFIFK